MNLKRRISAFFALLLVGLVLVCPSILWRIAQERASHSAFVVFDLLELSALDAERGTLPENAQNKLDALIEAGVGAFFAPECTADEILKGVIEGVSIYPAEVLPSALTENFSSAEGTVLILKDPSFSALQTEYLSRRFSAGECFVLDETVYFRIPVPYGRLEKSGVLPDLRSMEYISDAGIPIIYAPAPSFGSRTEELLRSLEFLCGQFSAVKALCPTGQIAAAWPNTKLLGDFVKERGLLMAQVEFSRVYGAGQQVAAAWPNVVSLHGVDREEVLKREIIRPMMLNRLVRAAEEREVKLLVLRLDPLRATAVGLKDYCEDVRRLRSRLDEKGFAHRWPQPARENPKIFTILSSVALQLLLWVLIARLAERYFGPGIFTHVGTTARRRFVEMILIVSILLGGAGTFIKFIPRISGGFAAGFLAAEAALCAMDFWKVPVRGAVQSFVLTIAGGLILTGYFSVPLYMYRMSSFSGVKLTLLLPPVLVLLIDLHKKEHPESLHEILMRPPLWSELVVIGAVLLAALVVIVRSGNFGFVNNTEIFLRDTLERFLVARPRTKEFLIGYPALVIWYYLRRKDLWAHWREALRLAVTLAFSSAVNSFCHFHTRLPLTLLRDFNGWWIGLTFGCLVLYLALRFGRLWRTAAAQKFFAALK